MKKFIATVAGAAIALSVFAPIAGAVPANSPSISSPDLERRIVSSPMQK